jgi:hypothetical protein
MQRLMSCICAYSHIYEGYGREYGAPLMPTPFASTLFVNLFYFQNMQFSVTSMRPVLCHG